MVPRLRKVLVPRRLLATLAVAATVAAAVASACSRAGDGEDGVATYAAGGHTGTTTTPEVGGMGFDAGSDDAGDAAADACAQQQAEGVIFEVPVDIVFVIDNSESMTEEILAVQNDIDKDFAAIIGQSGIDYRVIMFTRHGSATKDQSVCIEAPLSSIGPGGCATPPTQPGINAPKFFHYSIEVGSNNPWCLLRDAFKVPDEHQLAPKGWLEWLRPEAFKIFVMLTDDGISCTTGGKVLNDGDQVKAGEFAAGSFDELLLALSPEHFGTKQKRNYRWYSLVGLAPKDPQKPEEPWLPADPITAEMCVPGPLGPGTGHQALSVLTGGLRYPLCYPDNFDVVFNEIAKGVIDASLVPCEYTVPEPPEGETLDLDTVQVKYTPSVGSPVLFAQVDGLEDCGPDAFYIEDNTIELCPEACATVSADPTAEIDVLYGCDLVTR